MGPAEESRNFAELPPGDGLTRAYSTHMFDLVVVVLDALLDDGVVARRHLFEVLVDRFAGGSEARRRRGRAVRAADSACARQTAVWSVQLSSLGLAWPTSSAERRGARAVRVVEALLFLDEALLELFGQLDFSERLGVGELVHGFEWVDYLVCVKRCSRDDAAAGVGSARD